MNDQHHDDHHEVEPMPLTFAGTQREWEDFVRGRSVLDIEPARPGGDAHRSRPIRWAAWAAVVGALGFAFASVLVR